MVVIDINMIIIVLFLTAYWDERCDYSETVGSISSPWDAGENIGRELIIRQ